MKKISLLSLALVGVLAFVANANAATTITDWTFETSFTAITGTSAVLGGLAPEIGTGTARGVHANSNTVWSSPVGNGSSHSFSSNLWTVGDFYDFNTSTSGYSAIGVSWDQSSSNTGPRNFVLMYSLDGTNYTTFGTQATVLANAAPNNTWTAGTVHQEFNFFRANISTSIDNQATVYFRLVDNTTVSANGTTVFTAGTARLDNFKVFGIAPLVNPLYWDTNGASAGLGGTGTWDNTSLSWNNSSGTGTAVAWNSNNSAFFAGTAGTVTVAAAGVTTNQGIQFDVNGYTIVGTGAITMGTTSTIQVTNSSDTGTVNAKLSGVNGLTIAGNGTTVLGATNSDFTGLVTISGCTLSISNNANLGDSNNDVFLDSGTLKATDNVTMGSGRDLSGTGTLDVAPGKTLTVAGAVSTGDLTIANNGTVAMTGGSPVTGGVSYTGSGTLRIGATGTDTIIPIGNITNLGTGSATLNGNVNFGSSLRSISNTNAAGSITITGGLTNANRVNLTGPGTIDLQGDDSGLTNANPVQIGAQGQKGPTVVVHDANSLGTTGQIFLNSGFISAAAPITFGADLSTSFGANGSAGAGVSGGYTGSNQTWLGTMHLFLNSNNDERMTVNNTTTFAGGWAASDISTTGDTNIPPNNPLVINGTGHLILAGQLDVDVPFVVQTLTVDVNSSMTSSFADFLVVSGGTLNNGVDNALNTAADLTIGGTVPTPTNGTYNLNGHNQTLKSLTLSNGSVTGSSNTITATSNYDVRNGSIAAKLAGSVGLVKTTSDTVTLSGNSSYSGGTSVNGGTLIVSHANALGTGGLSINSGAVTQLNTGASAIAVPTLSIDGGSATPTSKLDIASSKAIVNNANLSAAQATHTTVQQQVLNAYDNFGWDLGGITSSTVQNDVNNIGNLTAVGYALNDDGGGNFYEDFNGTNVFGGKVTDSNSVLIRYTYLADLDLNGLVDGQDYTLFTVGYLGGAPYGADWAWGDMDYSNTIDSNDFSLFSAGYLSNFGLPTIASGGVVTPVPEPSTMVLAALGLAGVAALARKRRKN